MTTNGILEHTLDGAFWFVRAGFYGGIGWQTAHWLIDLLKLVVIV